MGTVFPASINFCLASFSFSVCKLMLLTVLSKINPPSTPILKRHCTQTHAFTSTFPTHLNWTILPLAAMTWKSLSLPRSKASLTSLVRSLMSLLSVSTASRTSRTTTPETRRRQSRPFSLILSTSQNSNVQEVPSQTFLLPNLPMFQFARWCKCNLTRKNTFLSAKEDALHEE